MVFYRILLCTILSLSLGTHTAFGMDGFFALLRAAGTAMGFHPPVTAAPAARTGAPVSSKKRGRAEETTTAPDKAPEAAAAAGAGSGAGGGSSAGIAFRSPVAAPQTLITAAPAANADRDAVGESDSPVIVDTDEGETDPTGRTGRTGVKRSRAEETNTAPGKAPEAAPADAGAGSGRDAVGESDSPVIVDRDDNDKTAPVAGAGSGAGAASNAGRGSGSAAQSQIVYIDCLQQDDFKKCGFYASFFAVQSAQYLATLSKETDLDITTLKEWVNDPEEFDSFIESIETLPSTTYPENEPTTLGAKFGKEMLKDLDIPTIITACGYAQSEDCTNINTTDIICINCGIMATSLSEKIRALSGEKGAYRTLPFNHPVRNRPLKVLYIKKLDINRFRVMTMVNNGHFIALLVDRKTGVMHCFDSLRQNSLRFPDPRETLNRMAGLEFLRQHILGIVA